MVEAAAVTEPAQRSLSLSNDPGGCLTQTVAEDEESDPIDASVCTNFSYCAKQLSVTGICFALLEYLCLKRDR